MLGPPASPRPTAPAMPHRPSFRRATGSGRSGAGPRVRWWCARSSTPSSCSTPPPARCRCSTRARTSSKPTPSTTRRQQSRPPRTPPRCRSLHSPPRHRSVRGGHGGLRGHPRTAHRLRPQGDAPLHPLTVVPDRPRVALATAAGLGFTDPTRRWRSPLSTRRASRRPWRSGTTPASPGRLRPRGGAQHVGLHGTARAFLEWAASVPRLANPSRCWRGTPTSTTWPTSSERVCRSSRPAGSSRGTRQHSSIARSWSSRRWGGLP